jgi:hypothetical protein
VNDRFAAASVAPAYGDPMEWKQLDLLTRAGFVATVMAVLGVLVPPVSLASALVAIVCSGVAVVRARRSATENRVAVWCLRVSIALVVLVAVGSAIYAALD